MSRRAKLTDGTVYPVNPYGADDERLRSRITDTGFYKSGIRFLTGGDANWQMYIA